MSMTLARNVEALVRKKIESGRYGSADEVILNALRSLEEIEKIEWLRAAIAEGEMGEGFLYTPELRVEMWETARRQSGGR